MVPANEVLQVEVKAGGNINAETYKVCYKHGEEDAYLMYPFTFTMLVANNVTVSHGSSSLFVVDQEKSIMVSGVGLESEDVFYLSTTECQSRDGSLFSSSMSEMPANVMFSGDKEYSNLHACLYSASYGLDVSVFLGPVEWRPSVASSPEVAPVHDMGGRIVFNHAVQGGGSLREQRR